MTQAQWSPPDHVWSASGVLFRDDRDRVLLVEPTYKPTWEIPGGMVEKGESPREACRREVEEELGLAIEAGRLLCVDYARPPFAGWEGLRFVFDGGVLDLGMMSLMRLQQSELASWRFVGPDDVDDLVAAPLGRRIRAAVAACSGGGGARYLEDGVWSDPG